MRDGVTSFGPPGTPEAASNAVRWPAEEERHCAVNPRITTHTHTLDKKTILSLEASLQKSPLQPGSSYSRRDCDALLTPSVTSAVMIFCHCVLLLYGASASPTPRVGFTCCRTGATSPSERGRKSAETRHTGTFIAD